MHPLKQYLQEVKEPICEFATRVSASRQTLYRIINGAQAPKPALARRIIEATGGAVSFGALYQLKDGEGGEIIGFSGGGDEARLNHERIRLAVETVVNHMTPQGTPDPPYDAIDIAAEAVVNTYSALSKITTRQGPDRLCQALRPVLEEILREYLGSPPPPPALDRGAELGAQLYFQSWKFDR